MRRWLARVENLEGAFPELDWINSRVRILGEHYAMACRSIESLIADGSMVEVPAPKETPTTEE